MIISRIKGGIGNQLFCYAMARRLALKNNVELIIDNISGFVRDFKYRRFSQLEHFNISAREATPGERLEPFGRLRRWLLRKYNSCRSLSDRNYIEQESMDFDPRLLDLKVNGIIYLDGYWQSERYFKDVEETIRKDLRIIPPSDAKNHQYFDRIKSCDSVALHVRWFESPCGKGVNNLTDMYYKNAVDFIRERINNPHFFIFSDDPNAAQARLSIPPDNATLVSHNEGDEMAYADLWLMSGCRHFITANSSFSWWGAWLGDNPDKIIITPDVEIRQGVAWWGFDGLIPDEWIKL